MPIDPDDPPIWLRKLHVTAEQLSPDEYPATPADGILQVCRLSNAQRKLVKAFNDSHGKEQAAAYP
jgi:hypothetical protein